MWHMNAYALPGVRVACFVVLVTSVGAQRSASVIDTTLIANPATVVEMKPSKQKMQERFDTLVSAKERNATELKETEARITAVEQELVKLRQQRQLLTSIEAKIENLLASFRSTLPAPASEPTLPPARP